jgi:hypothetical protein
VQVAYPVVGAERRDVVSKLARRVRGVDQHRSPDAGHSGGHRRDRDDGGGRRCNPVDHNQPRAVRAGRDVRRHDQVIPGADWIHRLYDPRPGARRVMAERLADRAVAVRADDQLVTRVQLQRAENRGHSLGHVAHPRRAGGVDAKEPGCPFPGRRHQPADLDPVEAVRIAFGALSPGGGRLAHDDRRDTERAVVEVENVGVEAKGLQQGRIHGITVVAGPYFRAGSADR